MAADAPGLQRRLGLTDATVIGMGSMIGAGVFAAFAPAAAAAGGALHIGLALAAVVAFCNASSSAQLAAQYPDSGGTYVYGRARIGPTAGFLAGWSFVIGKTASSAAMALTAAAYLVPAPWQRPVAVFVVLALAAVNGVGITRTAALTRAIVSVVLVVLVLVVAVGFVHLGSAGPTPASGSPSGAYGVLQSAGLLFFAFAGYARIATMGEEVRDPARVIPRAILTALGITLAIYAVVGTVALLVLGAHRLGAAAAPLVAVVDAAGAPWAAPVVQLGAAAAALGALLALLAGVGRTVLAMARNGDLPRALAAVHPRFAVPRRAEYLIAAIVSVLVFVTDLRGAIGFSSFGVLLYYFVANWAALTQDAAHRRYPRVVPVLGAVGCLVLVATLPPVSIVAGAAVAAVGLLVRQLRRGRAS